DEDAFYYITAMNENYAQPSSPEGAEADIIKGLYRLERRGPPGAEVLVRLVGSGAIVRHVQEAARRLDAGWNVSGATGSATSFSELARDARAVERRNRLFPLEPVGESHVAKCLGGGAPVIVATDYVRAYPQLIASYVEAPFVTLGTDGFGRSD